MNHNKLKFFLFILFVSSSYMGFSQIFPIPKDIFIEKPQLKIIYQYHYQLDSTNPDQISKRTLWLLIGDNYSSFEDHKKKWYKDEMRKINSQQQLQDWINKNAGMANIEDFTIIKNRKLKNLTYYGYILMSGHYKYEETPHLIWKLESDTANILEYTVQHAWTYYGGRIWHAWFTPAIPISDGPYKFMGLPGLILKAEDSKHYYTFEAIAIEQPAEGEDITCEENPYIETTREKFLEANRNLRLDIINKAQEAGLNAGAQQTAAQSMRLRNNPIELK
ncbi:MAG: Uncharacterized protein XD81_0979 [Bacteroidetes bacterium 38_7]|nr:MAG: Uncharacterized protein XD81_0979 [Bacteroidetes bacterium 38_7]HAL64863.1 hypothetical protein [Bacteroidales bacterium]